jgi:hypothetical protein
LADVKHLVLLLEISDAAKSQTQVQRQVAVLVLGCVVQQEDNLDVGDGRNLLLLLWSHRGAGDTSHGHRLRGRGGVVGRNGG